MSYWEIPYLNPLSKTFKGKNQNIAAAAAAAVINVRPNKLK